jgi:hypothetical protein
VTSIFDKHMAESYPYQYDGALLLGMVLGGVPSDPRVAEGWLRTKIKDTESRIQDMVAKTMVERSVDAEQALKIVNDLRNLNGFKRGGPEHEGRQGQLYVEGRQLKAGLKEAVSVAVGAGKLKLTGWGQTKKYLTNYVPEHIFVLEDELWLETVPDELVVKDDVPFDQLLAASTQAKEPTGVTQQFVHTHRGSSIQYQEFVRNALVQFTVATDHFFTDKQWALIWTTGELNGLGASRSQGYGRYEVRNWKLRPLKGEAKKMAQAIEAEDPDGPSSLKFEYTGK